VNLGHFLPDYTAYEELLDIFKAFTSIPILLEGERGYGFTVDDLRREVLGRGLSALLLSNPCNPTGKLVQGEDLHRWVALARELDCTLLLDEFYSHYIWAARPATCPPRAPPATSRTWTAIRWCCSTG
jgi:aspartate/methionine/tyrosine aminotransferase